MRLVTTQALHWLAFLGAMWLMFLPEVRGILNDNATSLTLLILLALGTFVAGVHAGVWRICAVGVFLAVSVPAVAWIQEFGHADPGRRVAAAGGRLRLLVDVAAREQAPVIVLWSDYVSPYAFVAKAAAYALEDDYEIELQWRPYTLDIASYHGIGAAARSASLAPRALQLHGRAPLRQQAGPCRSRDRRRSSMPGRPMPACSMPRSTACSAPTTISPSTASGGASSIPENVDAVTALLVEAGAPPGFAAFLAGEGGAEHDRLRGEAEASGVFGVPTFVFDGELFWGGDRIGLLRERLDEKGVKRRSGRG